MPNRILVGLRVQQPPANGSLILKVTDDGASAVAGTWRHTDDLGLSLVQRQLEVAFSECWPDGDVD